MPDCRVKQAELVDVYVNFIFFIEYFISAAAAEIVTDLLLNGLFVTLVARPIKTNDLPAYFTSVPSFRIIVHFF